MRKHLLTAALLASAASAHAAPTEQVFNNMSHEMIECAVYYSIVVVAVTKANKTDTAHKYQQASDKALGLASKYGDAAGLKQETSVARYKMSAKAMRQQIGDDLSNISILMGEHHELCGAALENPEGRFEFWTRKLGVR
ncbi:MAG TPA: hypothetical protein VMW05_11055 [Methyloceanibacter sp.]|nr:hypothetical protein [Methyloceanibacter sp.]